MNGRLVDALRYWNGRLRNARSLRRLAIAAYATAVRAQAFLPPPRLLLNGPPKSGTHLAADCLSLLPRMMFSGRHFALAEFVAPPSRPEDAQRDASAPLSLDEAALRRFLLRCPQGMFASAHARFHPVLRDLLADGGFRHVLVLRDPRDVAVSNAFFMTKEKWHRHHARMRALPTDDARLLATITGFASEGASDRPLAPIGEVVRGYLPWRETGALVVRFEDLVGPAGGGDEGVQLATVQSLAAFAGRELTPAQAGEVARRMYSRKSYTFRKGVAGDWRRHFNDEHRRAFKEVAPGLLAAMGYERDDEW